MSTISALHQVFLMQLLPLNFAILEVVG